MIDLDKLERLCREATPVPWESFRTCVFLAHDTGGFDIANCPLPKENAALIAALRNAAPELIAMARRYQWLRDEAQWAATWADDRDQGNCTAEEIDAAIDAAMQKQKT